MELCAWESAAKACGGAWRKDGWPVERKAKRETTVLVFSAGVRSDHSQSHFKVGDPWYGRWPGREFGDVSWGNATLSSARSARRVERLRFGDGQFPKPEPGPAPCLLSHVATSSRDNYGGALVAFGPCLVIAWFDKIELARGSFPMRHALI